MQIAIIGGGAAGFFSAIHVKENYPEAFLVMYEKSDKTLSKVKVSGGGRCNLTNGCTDINDFSESYPRGKMQMKKAFGHFDNMDTMKWFESHGVPLVIQEDNCVFPASQNSESIIDCFMNETKRLNIKIEHNVGVIGVEPIGNQIKLEFEKGSKVFDKVIVATGGSPKRAGLAWLENMGHEIEEPVPSLFTFNMPSENIKTLMGIVVENPSISIQGTKLKSDGPLLITHWGMSGPAVLKLSAYGARILSDLNYEFKIQVNWVNIRQTESVLDDLYAIVLGNSNKLLLNFRPYSLPERLWHYLLERGGLSNQLTWGQLGKKSLNKMVNILTNDVYSVSGKTTFKEEFVTCGGISLNSIDFKTMQSKVCPNLYFAGEVMDIDGITGGYNFQAAWTTAFIAAKLH